MAETIDDLDGVGPVTVENLESGGIDSLQKLAESSVEDITDIGIGESKAEDMIEQAQQSTVLIQSTEEVEEEYNNKKTIPTGLDKLDNCIEGGWQEGAVVSVYGDSSTGKTQLCMQALVEAIRDTGEDAVYIETEKDRYRPERIKNLVSAYDDLDYDEVKKKIHRVKAYDLDRQYNSYGAVEDNFDSASIVVIDSLVAQFRLSQQFSDRSTLSQRSSVMGKHLKAIETMSETLGCPVLFTNQIYKNPDSYGKDEHQYGGTLIQYVAQFSVYLRQSSGEVISCNVEAHPSTGDEEILISIEEDGIRAVN